MRLASRGSGAFALWSWPVVFAILAVVVALAVAAALFVPRFIQKPLRASENTIFQRPSSALVVRDGLPNVWEKLQGGTPIVVAFLGGSITEAAGNGGFVSGVLEHLKGYFPDARIKVINAGLGGTGSDLGAKRVGRDVIVQRPDLVFVEFAVNDEKRDCVADMDRIVTQIREDDPRTDIVFLYAATDKTLADLAKGKFSPAIQRHESVAARYGIPTLALGFDAARRIAAGQWSIDEFTADGVHPTVKGHESYSQEIGDALPAMFQVAKSKPAKPRPPIPPRPEAPPTPVVAQPLPPIEPMKDDSGAVAIRTWNLPLIGAQWVGSPEYPAQPPPVWRLYYRKSAQDSAMDASIGLDRQGWLPARWFEEVRGFTGSNSRVLATSGTAQGSSLGGIPLPTSPDAANETPSEVAVLTWQAPADGPYLIRASAAGLSGPTNEKDSVAGFNVVLFHADAEQGSSLAFSETRDIAAAPIRIEHRVDLKEGDQIAFVPAEKGFKFFALEGLGISIGQFAPTPLPANP